MSGSSKPDEGVIAKYASGTADEAQLNMLIADAWRTALTDPKERAEIAALLGAQESELDPKTPPYRAEVVGAGTFGSEILIALAIGFVLGFSEGFGKGVGGKVGEKAAERLLDLWTDHFLNRVNPLGSGRLGLEKENVKEEYGRITHGPAAGRKG